MIFLTWIREIDPKIWLPSRSTVRLHILRDCRRTLIFLSDTPLLGIFHDRVPVICDISMSEGSICQVYCLRYNDTHSRANVYQCMSKSQCGTPDWSHPPICELWWIIPHITDDRDRDTPEYLTTRRIYPLWKYFECNRLQ